MDFLQRTPFFRLLLPLIFGILVYQYVEIFQWVLLLMFSLSVLLLLVSFVLSKRELYYKFRWLFGCGIFLFIFSLGYSISEIKDGANHFRYLDQPNIYQVEITEAPVEKANSFLCRVKLLSVSDSVQQKSAGGKALIYFEKDDLVRNLMVGDRLWIGATFTSPAGVVNPNGFSYAAYLKRQGVGATAYLKSYQWHKSVPNTSFSIKKLAQHCRAKLLSIYQQNNINGDEFAVLAALTLGYKDALHPELREDYSTSGAMHILAVSGLHVGVIYLILSLLFSFMNRNARLKIYKTLIVLFLLWLYAFITGLSPSVVRATLMFSFVSIGVCFDRKSQIFNTIFVSAFLMLLIDPDNLFDVGFQLSYCAVISIIYFQPIFSKWLDVKNKVLKWSWDLFTVSLAAQIGTAPFALFYFHQFANYFLITNFIAIPAATIIIYMAVLLLMVSPVLILSKWVGFALYWTLHTLNYLIAAIHKLPNSVAHVSINLAQLLLVFIAIVFFASYFKTKKYYSLIAALSCTLLIFLINIAVEFKTLNSSRLVVFADSKNSHIDFSHGRAHFLFTTDSLSAERVAENYWMANKIDKQMFLNDLRNGDDGFISFQGLRCCMLTNNLLLNKTLKQPLQVDYLIIGNHLKPKINQIFENITPRKVIVDQTISAWYSAQIAQVCRDKKINFYSLAEHGAYTLEIKD